MARLLPVVAVMVLAAAAIVGANLASQGFLAARSGDVVVSPKGGAAGSLLAVLNVEGASKTPYVLFFFLCLFGSRRGGTIFFSCYFIFTLWLAGRAKRGAGGQPVC